MKSLLATALLTASMIVARADGLKPILDNWPEGTEHIWETPNESATAYVSTNPISAFGEFLSNASTNIIIIGYGISSTDFKKFGGGVAIGYELSQNVVPFLRLENYNGEFVMPSGTVQIQAPFRFGGWTVIPLVYTGVAVPLGKHSTDPVVGIVGTGLAVRLGTQFDLLAAYEVRSGLDNNICLGIGWKPNGW